ncbi:hypothetical protein Gotri_022935 [Gossypium trilobum]|uniref:Uncharacterized protein n=1 Tax=Gossypium trilobum TaxID=34281 RepID=A0A7J9DHE7_9ROSI|nr:hypothetical protein [Gossypium trilobum]
MRIPPYAMGVWFAVFGFPPQSVTVLLPSLRVIDITLPQCRLAIPPPFHILFSIFCPYHQASIFFPILPRFLAQRNFNISNEGKKGNKKEKRETQRWKGKKKVKLRAKKEKGKNTLVEWNGYSAVKEGNAYSVFSHNRT